MPISSLSLLHKKCAITPQQITKAPQPISPKNDSITKKIFGTKQQEKKRVLGGKKKSGAAGRHFDLRALNFGDVKWYIHCVM